MKHAASFLDRFQHLTPPDDAIRKAVAEVIKNVAGVPITREQVKMTRDVAFITCSSIARSAIRRSRVQILEELAKQLPKARQVVRDIR